MQDYCELAPEGHGFLSVKVTRLFSGDSRAIGSCTVAELIHEILQRHALGIRFREVLDLLAGLSVVLMLISGKQAQLLMIECKTKDLT